MSLITRCPACETMFKIVPDQLRVSDGWVRCGQCDEIFDASANMVQETPGATAAVAGTAAHWALASAGDRAETGMKVAPLEASETMSARVLPTPQPLTSGLAATTAEDPSIPQRVHDEPTAAARASEAGPSEALSDPSGRRRTDRGLEGGEAPGGEARRRTDPTSVPLSFMPERAVPSVWQGRGMRFSLALSAVVLLLGLCAQVVYVERDRIAAMEPSVRSWLVRLCEWQGCTVSALQRIDSIVVESSSFNKLRGDAYRLNFSIKNAAAIDLAVPAVELTLTDSQDQVLTRRVFLGAELGAKTSVLAPGAEWQGSWGISVKGTGISDHISGYRILAFYP